MDFSYQCHGHQDMNPQTWTGHIRLLSQTPPYEIEINTRESYFHILFGPHKYGNYICIPNWNIGTELARLADRFWNLERLLNTCPKLSTVDAVSISDALAAVAEYINI